MIETGIQPTPTPHTLTDVRATTSEYLGAGGEDVLLQGSPVAAELRARERKAAGFAAPREIDDELSALDLQERERSYALGETTTRPDRREVVMLTPDDANRQYGELGLKFDKPLPAAEAEQLAETKKRELAAAATFRAARAPTFGDAGGLGAGRAALSVATDFVGSALDPVNLAMALLPVVGPGGRALLASRFGALGGGAIAGGVEGMAGNALLEPLMVGNALAEQRDYHWYDSASNILLGGVLGGGFGALHGYLGRPRADAITGAPGAPPGSGGPGAGGPLLPVTGGPPAFDAYAAGWRAALEVTGERPPADLEAWARIPAWSAEAPMVRALDALSPETRRVAGQVATMQYLNGRPIDVEPLLKLDSDWRSPAADPVERLRLLVDDRRIAGLLEAPKLERAIDTAGTFGDFAPGELTVDAKRFQFKAGGDSAGVTDRLQGVTQWDRRLAGLSIVWEDNAGKLFVVDGHQRHGLATRLAAEGQSPQIHAILLRESAGETEGYARALAAFKNIAEGSGTAIDAAKILRETRKDPQLARDLDSGRLPQLPPTSALVRDASALAKLPDQAFGLVAAGKVEPAHAAHVTRILGEPKQQTAAVEMLAKLGPDTSEQARLIVEQIRAAGFKEGETVDLFGRRDVANSLMLERAKVLENTARALKKDAAIFRTLVDRESIAAEAGNVLARDANVERLTDDKAALAVLEALSNRAGTIGTALNEAARGLSGGKTLRAVTADFLKTVRAEASALRPTAKAEGQLGAMTGLEDLKRGGDPRAGGDTIGDPAAVDRQKRELAEPKDLFASTEKLAEAELERVRAEAEQAIAAHPELKAELAAADLAAKDADLFGKAADALAGCKLTGGQ